MERKTRVDYQLSKNRKFAKAKLVSGLSYTDIALNPNLNPDKITPQRIQQIVKTYLAKFGENFND